MLKTKRNVFFIGVIGSVLFLLPAILNQISSCYQKNWFFCSESYEIVAILALPFPLLLLLSLITYKMRDEAFRAWWGFARWWVPVIIVVTFLLNSANSGGGLGIGGAVSSAFDILIIGILYAVLIITSLVKIVRTSLKLRWEEKGISGDKLKDLNISLTAAIITAIALILIAGWFVLLAL